jgi:tRNA(Arg) A34 adenosine deaminase TadA
MPVSLENTPEKIAWLETDEGIYSASTPIDSARSPVQDLIERIYHSQSLLPVSRARTILRERIHANYEATVAERELVKVTAKRISAPSDRRVPNHFEPLPEVPPVSFPEIEGFEIGTVVRREEIPARLERLKLETRRTQSKWTSDRAISALLVDRENRLVTYAWNTSATIRTRHAEMNLCEHLETKTPDGKIPKGATLYVSLKPCRMCAARIWETAADPAQISVVYLENDPGPLAQGTMLEPRSAARVRYLGLNHPLFSAEVMRANR